MSGGKTANKSGLKEPWKPGQSGNPSGRPKMPEELKRTFRELSPFAAKALGEIVKNSKAKDSDRIRAAEVILDRAYGKAVQAVETSGSMEINTKPLTMQERKAIIEQAVSAYGESQGE